jgi:predicted CXXCH cytochrome family protein
VGCHTRETGDGSIPADGDFIANYTQYEEFQASPHAALTCTTCHDPHQSVVYTGEDADPGGGLAALCVDCHTDMPETAFHSYPGFACEECHMPPVVASGVRDPERLWTDMRTHLVYINTDPGALQFSEDGETAMLYITVRYACGRCHSDRSAEGLANSSAGYHERWR